VCLQLLASIRCELADWQGAQQVLNQLTEGLQLEDVDEQDFIQVSALYLKGTIKQATGDLDGALQYFTHPALALLPEQKATAVANQDLRILSALNTILILRPRRDSQDKVKNLVSLIEPICAKHANLNFKVAMQIVVASSTDGLPIMKMKSYLSTSASIAKKHNNNLMLCMAINLMTSNFFVDIIGEKAEMSARAGKTLANRTQKPLWQAAANQLLANTLSFGGKRGEAEEAAVEAQRCMQMVPEGVQERFRTGV
jgi:hypothetical protein